MVGLAGGGAGEEVFGFRADIWKQLLLPAFRGGQGVVVVHRAHGEGKAHLLERAGAFDGVRLLLDNIRHDLHSAFKIIFQPRDFFVVRWPAFMAHADFARDLLVRRLYPIVGGIDRRRAAGAVGETDDDADGNIVSDVSGEIHGVVVLRHGFDFGGVFHLSAELRPTGETALLVSKMVAHGGNVADSGANGRIQAAENESKGPALAAAVIAEASLSDFFMEGKPCHGNVDADDGIVEIRLFAVRNVLVHVHPAFVHFFIAVVDGLAGDVRIIRVDVHFEIDEIRQHGDSSRSWTRSRHGDDGGIFAGGFRNGQKTVDFACGRRKGDFVTIHLVVRKSRQRRHFRFREQIPVLFELAHPE